MNAAYFKKYIESELTVALAKIERLSKQIEGLSASLAKSKAKAAELSQALTELANNAGTNFTLPPSLSKPPVEGLTLPPAFMPAPPIPQAPIAPPPTIVPLTAEEKENTESFFDRD